MKVTYYIDSKNRISIRTYEGIVTKEKLILSMKMVWEDEEYSIMQNHLVDMRNAEFRMTSDDLKEFVDAVVTNPSIHDRKVALLVARPQEAAITTMYKELSQHKHLTEVFASDSKALDYIGAPPDFYKMLLQENAKVITL